MSTRHFTLTTLPASLVALLGSGRGDHDDDDDDDPHTTTTTTNNNNKNIPSTSTSSPLGCLTCHIPTHASLEAQRDHYRSAWHVHNVRARVRGKAAITEREHARLTQQLEKHLNDDDDDEGDGNDADDDDDDDDDDDEEEEEEEDLYGEDLYTPGDNNGGRSSRSRKGSSREQRHDGEKKKGSRVEGRSSRGGPRTYLSVPTTWVEEEYGTDHTTPTSTHTSTSTSTSTRNHARSGNKTKRRQTWALSVWRVALPPPTITTTTPPPTTTTTGSAGEITSVEDKMMRSSWMISDHHPHREEYRVPLGQSWRWNWVVLLARGGHVAAGVFHVGPSVAPGT